MNNDQKEKQAVATEICSWLQFISVALPPAPQPLAACCVCFGLCALLCVARAGGFPARILLLLIMAAQGECAMCQDWNCQYPESCRQAPAVGFSFGSEKSPC